jgi:hypothetical protein
MSPYILHGQHPPRSKDPVGILDKRLCRFCLRTVSKTSARYLVCRTSTRRRADVGNSDFFDHDGCRAKTMSSVCITLSCVCGVLLCYNTKHKSTKKDMIDSVTIYTGHQASPLFRQHKPNPQDYDTKHISETASNTKHSNITLRSERRPELPIQKSVRFWEGKIPSQHC